MGESEYGGRPESAVGGDENDDSIGREKGAVAQSGDKVSGG